MTILSCEQIDALHGSAHHDDCWMCDLIATARAYHDSEKRFTDLRNAVLALADKAQQVDTSRANVARALREVVALVERGE